MWSVATFTNYSGLTGAAQLDGACLLVEGINRNTRTICFTRKKLKSRGSIIKPTLFRFSADKWRSYFPA
jgi:hypothetical protein